MKQLSHLGFIDYTVTSGFNTARIMVCELDGMRYYGATIQRPFNSRVCADKGRTVLGAIKNAFEARRAYYESLTEEDLASDDG